MLRYDSNLVEFQGFLISDELAERIADHLRGLEMRAAPLRLELVTPIEEDGVVEFEPPLDAAASPEDELPVLTGAEWEALRMAVDELDGDFTVNRLYEELGGQLAKNAINDLGQRLQDAGWLLAGSGNKPRTCTDALIEQVALHYGE
jgi:hypothetical protein